MTRSDTIYYITDDDADFARNYAHEGTATMTTESSPNMKQRQAADYLGVSIRFLQLRDRDGTGPRSIKLGRLRRYRREDLDAWLLAHREPNGAAA